MKKISFCIVCMNRLHQLKETLLVSLTQYLNNPNIEFVLLNYNSQDGMDEWVSEHLSEHLASGLLRYYKTTEPKVFSHSHSKNMVFNLASGEILCSINADHFIGEGFDVYLFNKFTANSRIFISPYVPENSTKKYIPPRDVVGKICVRKKDFLKVKGFDERFKNYGFEDIDFVKRLKHYGLRQIVLSMPKFLEFVEHGDEERVQKPEHGFEAFVRYSSPSESEIIYLNHDKSYERVTFLRIDSMNTENPVYAFRPRNFIYSFEIKGDRWENGSWYIQKNQLFFLQTKKSNRERKLTLSSEDTLSDENLIQNYFKVKSDYNLTALNAMRSFMKNLSYMRSNDRSKRIGVNNGKFGAGFVQNLSSLPNIQKA